MAVLYILVIVSVVLFSQCEGTIIDMRQCGDPECKNPISTGITTVRYSSLSAEILSFAKDETVTVFSKLTGRFKTYWEVEIKGKRGYAPKGFIIEQKIIIPNLNYKVPTSNTQKSSENISKVNEETKPPDQPKTKFSDINSAESTLNIPPISKPSEEFATESLVDFNSVTQPAEGITPAPTGVTPSYEVVEGTTIYLNAVEDTTKSIYKIDSFSEGSENPSFSNMRTLKSAPESSETESSELPKAVPSDTEASKESPDDSAPETEGSAEQILNYLKSWSSWSSSGENQDENQEPENEGIEEASGEEEEEEEDEEIEEDESEEDGDDPLSSETDVKDVNSEQETLNVETEPALSSEAHTVQNNVKISPNEMEKNDFNDSVVQHHSSSDTGFSETALKADKLSLQSNTGDDNEKISNENKDDDLSSEEHGISLQTNSYNESNLVENISNTVSQSLKDTDENEGRIDNVEKVMLNESEGVSSDDGKQIESSSNVLESSVDLSKQGGETIFDREIKSKDDELSKSPIIGSQIEDQNLYFNNSQFETAIENKTLTTDVDSSAERNSENFEEIVEHTDNKNPIEVDSTVKSETSNDSTLEMNDSEVKSETSEQLEILHDKIISDNKYTEIQSTEMLLEERNESISETSKEVNEMSVESVQDHISEDYTEKGIDWKSEEVPLTDNDVTEGYSEIKPSEEVSEMLESLQLDEDSKTDGNIDLVSDSGNIEEIPSHDKHLLETTVETTNQGEGSSVSPNTVYDGYTVEEISTSTDGESKIGIFSSFLNIFSTGLSAISSKILGSGDHTVPIQESQEDYLQVSENVQPAGKSEVEDDELVNARSVFDGENSKLWDPLDTMKQTQNIDASPVCEKEPSCHIDSANHNSESTEKCYGEMQQTISYNSSLLFLVITSLTVLIFTLGYYYIEKQRRDGSHLAKISGLEKALMVSTRECKLLKDNMVDMQEKLNSAENSSCDSTEMDQLREELHESKSTQEELQEQVLSLEKELEAATEAGLELNRMLAEFLSSQHGSDTLVKNVEHLQQQLDMQQGTIENMNASLEAKTKENETLQEELSNANERIRSLEDDLKNVNETISKLQTEKFELEDQWKKKQSDLEKQLTEATEARVSLQSAIDDLREQVSLRDNEVTILQDCLKQLKQDDGEGEDRLEALLDVGHTKAQLALLSVERDSLKERLKDEDDARKLLEDHMKVVSQEVASLRLKFDEAEKEKQEAQTRLEVLSIYFKEKEMELQKALGLQEAMCLQKEGDATSTFEKIQSLKEEVESYKSQNELLKKEILDQERGLKTQMAVLEKKAHENWVAARQAERKLEESKQEASQLRNRLTIVEKNITNAHDSSKINSSLSGETNGELPTSPLHMDGHPASPPLIAGQSLPPSPFMGMPPPFMPPPPPPPGVPFMPPPPPLYPRDRRLPPVGRMSSPPPPPRYSPGDYSPPPSPPARRPYISPHPPPYDASPDRFRHRSPPPPFDLYPPPPTSQWEDSHGSSSRPSFRPLAASPRENTRDPKGSALSSGHSSESLEKSSRHSGRV